MVAIQVKTEENEDRRPSPPMEKVDVKDIDAMASECGGRKYEEIAPCIDGGAKRAQLIDTLTSILHGVSLSIIMSIVFPHIHRRESLKALKM